MFSQLPLSVLALGLLSLLLLVSFIYATRKRLRMPPGPLGVPLLGNKHQMPAVKPWVKFAELNKTYGESLVMGLIGCFSSC